MGVQSVLFAVRGLGPIVLLVLANRPGTRMSQTTCAHKLIYAMNSCSLYLRLHYPRTQDPVHIITLSLNDRPIIVYGNAIPFTMDMHKNTPAGSEVLAIVSAVAHKHLQAARPPPQENWLRFDHASKKMLHEYAA